MGKITAPLVPLLLTFGPLAMTGMVGALATASWNARAAVLSAGWLMTSLGLGHLQRQLRRQSAELRALAEELRRLRGQ